MKIFNNQHVFSLSLNHLKDSARMFGDLKVGDKISAGIMSRNGSSAELLINGRRIAADFTGGVPKGTAVDLVLTEKTQDRIVFSIAGKQPIDDFTKLLSPLSILSDSKTADFQLHNLVKFINMAKPDLMALNLFLAGIARDEKGTKGRTELFNYLLVKGISFSTLADLSFITGGRMGEMLYTLYYSLIKPEKKGLSLLKDEEIEDKMGSIVRELSSDGESFKEIADILFADVTEDRKYCEIPFPDGESFSKLKYISQQDSLFLEIEFSAIGKISAVIKSDNSGTIINIFSDNNDSIIYLKERSEILKGYLELMNVKKPAIGYYSSKKMIDKIEAWCTDFYIKRDFDVKI